MEEVEVWDAEEVDGSINVNEVKRCQMVEEEEWVDLEPGLVGSVYALSAVTAALTREEFPVTSKNVPSAEVL